MSDPYIDAPLCRHEGSQEFRLVELKPSELSKSIKCTLRTYAFTSRSPPYTALSYTWGQKVKPKEIELNGIPFPVGESLWSFLDQMRRQRQFRVYWIDAVCIDQDSMLERNHQVRMMRQIYSNAACVSIWLGGADEHSSSDIAMDFHRDMSTSHAPEANEKQAEAIFKLYTRDYWSRIWVVQEIFLARDITVYWGSKSVSWQRLKYFNQVLVQGFREQRYLETLTLLRTKATKLIIERDAYRLGAKYTSLTELLVSFDNYEATNTLDVVYGVCGLAETPLGFTIDYKISPEDLLVKLIHCTCAAMRHQDVRVLRDFARVMSAALKVEWSQEEMMAHIASAEECRDWTEDGTDLTFLPSWLPPPRFGRGGYN